MLDDMDVEMVRTWNMYWSFHIKNEIQHVFRQIQENLVQVTSERWNTHITTVKGPLPAPQKTNILLFRWQ
mgnify:CR=1 FL=1